MALDKYGREIPDPKPVAIPTGFKRPETLAEQVQRLVRRYSAEKAEAEGFETLEDAEDFDVGDDLDPRTPFEVYFDPVLGKELTLQEFKDREELLRKRFLQEQKREFEALDRVEVQKRALGPRNARTEAKSSPEGATPAAPKGGGVPDNLKVESPFTE